MINVLFLCGRNDARSQMAEAFARALAKEGTCVFSAGRIRGAVHALAVKVMAEIGIDISAAQSKAISDLPVQPVDVVVDLGERGAGAAVLLPGRPEWVNWNLSDPDAVKGAEDTVLRTFREMRDRIRGLVDDFFDKGYLSAFIERRSAR